jgi:hypothetical protein
MDSGGDFYIGEVGWVGVGTTESRGACGVKPWFWVLTTFLARPTRDWIVVKKKHVIGLGWRAAMFRKSDVRSGCLALVYSPLKYKKYKDSLSYHHPIKFLDIYMEY